MSRYSKYFLQHLLWLDDGQCRYYVQDPRLCHNDILDVPVVVYDQERDAEQMLLACMAHNTFWVIDRLRGFLSEDCHGYHFVYKMADHEVVRAAAGELTHRAFQVVIEPGNGWAVRTDDVTDQPLVPVAVEPAPEVAAIFEELKQELNALVAEQQKKYEQYEADLAGLSEAEQAAVYGKKAAGSIWEATVGGLVETLKALPGYYKGYLKTLRKVALYPSQLGAVTAECVATGGMGPLKAEIDKVVRPLANGWGEAWKYERILCVLLTDLQTLELLQDFAKRYYEATHPLELAEMGASASSDIVVTVLLAIFTAGVGAAANVATKSVRMVKVAKLLERLAKTLKRVGYRQKLSKKHVAGSKTSSVKKKPGKTKSGMPEPEMPKADRKARGNQNSPEKTQTPDSKEGGKLDAYRSPSDDKAELIIKSSTLTEQLDSLRVEGWRIIYGESGKGSYANKEKKIIAIDKSKKDDAIAFVRTLAHENGHALYKADPYVPSTGLTKKEYIDRNVERHLKDEGEATLNNLEIRDEIVFNGGPDIGVGGTKTKEYEMIYEVYKNSGDREKARKQIGGIFADGERPSTNPSLTYREYYSGPYEEYYDRLLQKNK